MQSAFPVAKAHAAFRIQMKTSTHSFDFYLARCRRTCHWYGGLDLRWSSMRGRRVGHPPVLDAAHQLLLCCRHGYGLHFSGGGCHLTCYLPRLTCRNRFFKLGDSQFRLQWSSNVTRIAPHNQRKLTFTVERPVIGVVLEVWLEVRSECVPH